MLPLGQSARWSKKSLDMSRWRQSSCEGGYKYRSPLRRLDSYAHVESMPGYTVKKPRWWLVSFVMSAEEVSAANKRDHPVHKPAGCTGNEFHASGPP